MRDKMCTARVSPLMFTGKRACSASACQTPQPLTNAIMPLVPCYRTTSDQVKRRGGLYTWNLRVCLYCGLYVSRKDWVGDPFIQRFHADCLGHKARRVKAAR